MRLRNALGSWPLRTNEFPYRRVGGPRIPASEKSSRACATTANSWSIPSSAKTGVAWPGLAAGLALCAATQIRHEADALWFA